MTQAASIGARCIWVLLILLCSVAPAIADEREERRKELGVKAALVLKFAAYIDWPDDRFLKRNSPIQIGVLESGDAADVFMKSLAKRTVGKHPVEVLRFKKAEDVSFCHLLFIPEKRARELPELVKRFRSRGVVFVGESRDFANQGGTVNFYLEKRKIRFEINVDEAKRSRVEFSSKLLKLARVLHDKKKDKQ